MSNEVFQLSIAIQSLSNKTKESQTLASLGDWLLPMLMNGRVTVGKAEEYVQDEEPNRVGMAEEERIHSKSDNR